MTFTYEEGSLLVRLLIAHCLTDFLWQPDRWVKEKKERVWKSKYLWIHAGLTGAIAFLWVWNPRYWPAILLLTISHLLIDGLKLSIERRKIKNNRQAFLLFLADQLLHLLVILSIWLYLIDGWHKIHTPINHFLTDYRILLRLLGYLLVTGPAGFIIQFMTRRWAVELNPPDSLRDAGKWIGILERILTLTLLYCNQFAAIGFLITAKSILRITDQSERRRNEPGLAKPFSVRKHTEYVLIGTFLSFTIAMITGLVINRLLQR